MTKKLILIILAVVIVFVITTNLDNDEATPPEPDKWQKYREADVAKVSKEWQAPAWLKVNTEGWEDGAYITDDGNTLYFAYYPRDIINDLQTRDFIDDIDVYYSQKPFTTRKKHKISEDLFSEGGMMISSGDMYYMSNRLDKEDIGKIEINDNIYKNGELLSFNTIEDDEGDPHYCKARDELYFWKKEMGKGQIFVYDMKEVKKLPYPVNTGIEDIQPFLTKDCNTMYFSSRREGVMKIYKSKRLGDNSWDNPEAVIESKNGVGEPTLTADEKFLYFVQIFVSDTGENNADIFYIEKK